MNLFAKCLRIAWVVSATLAPAAGASAFVLGQPVTGAIVTPVPPLRLPPTPEVCLQRLQRRVNECNAAFACGWESPNECFDNLNLCIEAAEQIYDNCIAGRSPPHRTSDLETGRPARHARGMRERDGAPASELRPGARPSVTHVVDEPARPLEHVLELLP